jgi:Sulfotransferase domain
LSQQQLPNLIIAGVVKGGTTSLYSYLSRHPDICSSTVKETCYFSAFRYRKPVEPFEKYQQYFSHYEGQKYIMEATPGYFDGGIRVAKEIKKSLGDDVKIIAIFREPISRLLSFFKSKKSVMELENDLTFDQYLELCKAVPESERWQQENNIYWGIDGGFYANHLSEWFEVFGDSLKILFFDDLKNNPQLLLQNVCQWLDIDRSIFDSESLEVENQSINYKNKGLQQLALFLNHKAEKFWRSNPEIKIRLRKFYYTINGKPHQDEISDRTLEYLKSIYQPYNQRLADLLVSKGYTNLPQWLRD